MLRGRRTYNQMLNRLNSIPEDTPFQMMNALWFKSNGGLEKYRNYLREAAPITAKYGAEASMIMTPMDALIGRFDADLMFFVSWPNKAAFLEMIADPDYMAITHLRDEAITGSYLVPCLPA